MNLPLIVRHLRQALIVLLTSCAISTQASSQRTPLIMQHGIRSGAETWDVFRTRIEQDYPVAPVAISTPWRATIDSQSRTLDAAFGSMGGASLAFGHSAGGLVLRQWVTSGHHLRGLVTVGSPHWGAPLADNVRDSRMQELALPIASTLALISMLFAPPDLFDSEEMYHLGAIASIYSVYLSGIDAIINEQEFGPNYPIWWDLVGSGVTNQALNSAPSLQAQAIGVLTRASIRTSINYPQDAFWRLAFTEEEMDIVYAMKATAAFAAMMGGVYLSYKYCNPYSGHFSVAGCMGSTFMFDIGAFVEIADHRFCAALQWENVPYGSTALCPSSDAVVPFDNQWWGGLGYSRDFRIPGVSHPEQTRSPLVREAVEQFLEYAGLTRCGQGPTSSLALSLVQGFQVGGTAVGSVVRRDACNQVNQDLSPLVASVGDTSVARIEAINANSITVRGIRGGQTTLVVGTQSAQTSSPLSVGGDPSISVSLSYAPNSQFLVGDPITVSAHVASGTSIAAYEWRVNGQPHPSNSASLMFFFAGPVEVSVLVRNVAGGQATASTFVMP